MLFPVALATALLAASAAAHSGHAENHGNNLVVAPAASTTLYITEGATQTLVLPVPDASGDATEPPVVTPVGPPPVVVTAGAEQLLCDGSVLGMAVVCGLGLLAL